MVYAVPYRARSLVLIYRADLLVTYDITVPNSWDELTAAAVAVRGRLRADGHDEIAGFVGAAVGGYDENYRLLGSTLFPAWGWRWNRGSGRRPRVCEPATVEALSQYAALVRAAGPENSAAMTAESARARFGDGRAAFLIDDARAFVAAQRALGMATVGIAMVPAGPSGRTEPGLFAPALCIAAGSERRDSAWELLRFLISPDALLADAIAGDDPETARESVFASAAFASAFAVDTREVLSVTRAHARINRPLIPFARELGEIVGEAARAAIAGAQTAEAALRAAQATIDGLHWSDERPHNLGRAG
jgi:ABC-type glycerol-3-phosphate transport system substrate-binding protein